jgi:hypothetical protein
VFPSSTVTRHILRGILGLGFLVIALQYWPVLGWWTLLPAAAALICFGGCPMCWFVGLIETIFRRKSRSACELP